MAERHQIPLPATDVEGLRQWFRFRDFAHFVEVYALLQACLVEPADYELVTHELGAQLATEDVRYAEVTFTLSTEFGLSAEAIDQIVQNGLEASFRSAPERVEVARSK